MLDVGGAENYDAVVVGAGTAGCVIARRLVDAGWRVALLEAGPTEDRPDVADPAQALGLPSGPLDWQHLTVPQGAAGNRRISIAAGRVVGGSSSINNTIFARGSRLDFDGWAAAGNEGWAYDDVARHFTAIEDFDGGGAEGRGTGGPIPVMSRYDRHPVMSAFVEAAEQAGHPRNPDYNLGELRGVAFMQHNARGGVRQSAASAYLRPVAEAPGLTLLTGCDVRRLRFDGVRCVGVDVVRDGVAATLLAEREVVVCAGALGSPKLLMLSGIGPAAQLADAGIASRVDLPGVGANLQDHTMVIVANAAAQAFPPAAARHTQYQALAFASSAPGRSHTDLQFQAIHLAFAPPGSGPEHGFTLLCVLTQPESRGSVRLDPADPDGPPLVDPCYLSNPVDVDALESAVAQGREILRQPALAPWLADEMVPGPGARSSDEVREYVRQNLLSFYHPAGTCRMGCGPDAVVDASLRVTGVDGLRVADASIMPRITSANTHAPSLAIGERAAELLLAAAAQARHPEEARPRAAVAHPG